MPFSLEDKHIIVTYHYVRNPSADFSGIYPCPLDEFEKQIEFLSHNYRICSISDVFEGAVAKNEERLCALTFDDGLKDHYVNVPSVLKKYSVKATFFIITNVFNGFLPLAHKLHVLLSRFGIEELIIAFDKSLLDKPFGNSKRVNYGGDFRIDNFKEAITKSFPERRNDFLKEFLDKTGFSEKSFAAELFMDEEELKSMSDSGFLIGNHTCSHQALDLADGNMVDVEISKASKYLEKILGERPVFFSYPYGRFSQDAQNILVANGIRYAVTVERKAVSGRDAPFALPRYDTNDIRDFLKQEEQR